MSQITAPDVFAPAKLGPITLRNRIIKSATFEGRTPQALVTNELIEFHRRPAAGGVGMTTVAYCAVQPEGRTERGQLWMRPEVVPGLRELTDAIHAEGAAASAQIGH
ncbi:NADH:flavin oxidoreductase, partial [Rhodococcus hoagii]|nr:NADH:flavin oxidoreductase [Prescottella equi]